MNIGSVIKTYSKDIGLTQEEIDFIESIIKPME